MNHIITEIQQSETLENIEKWISRALESPKEYYFKELYDVVIKKVEATRSVWIETLKIFVDGDWNDYKVLENRPQLSREQSMKLKELTLMSVGAKHRVVKFAELESRLGIQSSDLTTFIVESIYHGVISGTIDAEKQVLDVTWAKSREVTDERLKEIGDVLSQWVDKVGNLISTTNKQISAVREQSAAKLQIEGERMERITSEMSTRRWSVDIESDGLRNVGEVFE